VWLGSIVLGTWDLRSTDLTSRHLTAASELLTHMPSTSEQKNV